MADKAKEPYITQCLAKVAARLRSGQGPTADIGCPNPNRYCKDAESIKEMIDQHGGVDVRIKDLRTKWTERVLQKHGAGLFIGKNRYMNEQKQQQHSRNPLTSTHNFHKQPPTRFLLLTPSPTSPRPRGAVGGSRELPCYWRHRRSARGQRGY